MTYIRTKKNKYNIDIIIDISDNLEFIENSGLEWIKIDSEIIPNMGDYFYNEKVISTISDDYKLIEDIIFNFEEPNRIERERNNPVIFDEQIVEEESVSNEEPLNLEPPIDEETIQEILNLPKPKPLDLSDIESTLENYEIFKTNLQNINVTISAYDSGNYTFENNKVSFNPPLEYPNGLIQEFVIIPLSITIEEQIELLKISREQMLSLLDRIKTDLQITDD